MLHVTNLKFVSHLFKIFLTAALIVLDEIGKLRVVPVEHRLGGASGLLAYKPRISSIISNYPVHEFPNW
jgi:hypothetical protein